MNQISRGPWRWRVLVAILLLALCLFAAGRQPLTWIPHRLATQRLAADRLDAAQWWINFAERVGGHSAESTSYRSRLARKSGDAELAWQCLNDAIVEGLSADRVVREQILIRAQFGDIGEAQRMLPVLLQGSPRDAPEVCEAFALGFCKTHRSMETAVGLLNAWVVDYPEDARPHLLLAELSLEVMDVENAIQELRQTLRLAPNHGRAALALGKISFQQQDPWEALTLFQAAALSKSVRPTALVWQARCWRTVGRTEEAQAILNLALDEAPDSPLGHIEQANLEISAGDFAAASARLRSVIARTPYHHEARFALATALRSLGQLDEAREQLAIVTAAKVALVRARHLARDVALDAENVDLRAEIGQIELAYGDPEKALPWLHSVLMIDPQHLPTLQTLDAYYAIHPTSRPPAFL